MKIALFPVKSLDESTIKLLVPKQIFLKNVISIISEFKLKLVNFFINFTFGYTIFIEKFI